MSRIDTSLTLSLQQSNPIRLDVNLHCKAGELLALIGPSGSGKSTVLRTIAGLQSVANAQLSCGKTTWLDTQRQINVTPQARSVGLVFQHYALFPHMSALDNVLLAIPKHREGHGKLTKTARKAMAIEWLARTNMTGLEDRKPAQLSGGQRQRIALARALGRQPQVLLLDEPFSAVDQQTRRKLYRELAHLRADLDIPMILVTHDINEVQQLADSLCLIHKGSTLQQGDVQHVINEPKNKAIARLLGHQNLFDATVSHHSDQYTRYQLSHDEYLMGPPGDIAIGAKVNLLVAPSAISLDMPTGTTADDVRLVSPLTTSDNQLKGTISNAVGLGDELSLRIHLNNIPKSLRFRLPLYEAKARNITPGVELKVHIRPSGVHAMAVQD